MKTRFQCTIIKSINMVKWSVTKWGIKKRWSRVMSGAGTWLLINISYAWLLLLVLGWCFVQIYATQQRHPYSLKMEDLDGSIVQIKCCPWDFYSIIFVSVNDSVNNSSMHNTWKYSLPDLLLQYNKKMNYHSTQSQTFCEIMWMK